MAGDLVGCRACQLTSLIPPLKFLPRSASQRRNPVRLRRTGGRSRHGHWASVRWTQTARGLGPSPRRSRRRPTGRTSAGQLAALGKCLIIYVTKQMPNATDSAVRPVTQAEGDLTPQAMQEFRRLFQEWRDSYPTADQLEAGGLGDLGALAPVLFRWALGHRRPSDCVSEEGR